MPVHSRSVCFICKTTRNDCRKYYFTGDRKPTASFVYICKKDAAARTDIRFAVKQRVSAK